MKNTFHTDTLAQAHKLTERTFRYFNAPFNLQTFRDIKEEFATRLVERRERQLAIMQANYRSAGYQVN